MRRIDYQPYPRKEIPQETATPFDTRPFERVRCPNAWSPGGGLVFVEPGDLVIFEEIVGADGSTENRIARLLSLAMRDGTGQIFPHPFFFAIVPSTDSTMSHGSVRLVDPERVRRTGKAGGDFARWFFTGIAPSAGAVWQVQQYGALNDTYLGKHLTCDGMPKLHANDPEWPQGVVRP